MRQYLYAILVGFLLLGCQTSGRNTKDIELEKKKLEAINKNIADNNNNKLGGVAIYAAGVDAALNNGEKTPETKVAEQLNDRVVSIAGIPNVQDLTNMQLIVTKLLSKNAKDREEGERLLKQRDDIIVRLQLENDNLRKDKDTQYNNLSAKAGEVAARADAAESELSEYKKWFGLGAIFKGFKTLFISFLWGITIFTIIFLVLRILSKSHPAFAMAFGIFSFIGSTVIQLVKGIVPDSTKIANLIDFDEYDVHKRTLTKLVKTFEKIKLKPADINQDGLVDIDDILLMFDRAMDEDEKDLVKLIKKS